MFKNFKIYSLFLVFTLLVFGFYSLPAQASTCSQNTNINVVVSNPAGAFIPNTQVTVYQQVLDINGQSKPGQQVAWGQTDAILGTAHLSWRLASDTAVYVLKLQTINNSQASFWYYNQSFSCGQTLTLQKTLSGLKFILHDSAGQALTNTRFNIYSQVYNSLASPQEQFNQLLTSPSSGVTGQVTVYLPQGSLRSMDRQASDVYALNLNYHNQNFNLYNLAVHDGQLTTVNYFIPALQVKLQDATGALFPKGTRVMVFKQTVDTNNLRQVGQEVGDFTLGDNGSGTIDLPAGLYVLGIKNNNNTYQYFWDMQVNRGQANTYTVTSTTSLNNNSSTNSCQNNSTFTLAVQNFAGQLVPGLNFALYQQRTSIQGLPVAGQQVGNGQISSSGQASFNFRPDPRSLYALKIWDRNSRLGAFWFFSAVRFTCGQSRTLTKTIPALHIILRNSQGQLKRNYDFSLYAQRYDADHQAFYQDSDAITNLRTNGGGEATVYLAPYNPYLPGQSGIYALKVRDASGRDSSFYNIKIATNQDQTFQSILSGAQGELRDANGQLLANKSLKLYREKTSGPYLSLGSSLLDLQTDSQGQFKFEYPAGTYALVVPDDLNRQDIFWNIRLGQTTPALILKTSMVSFRLLNPQGQEMANNPTLQLYSLILNSTGHYQRGVKLASWQLKIGQSLQKSLAAGTYLAIYTGLGNQQYGQAFYLRHGENYSVNLRISASDLITDRQSFYLPAVAAGIIPRSSSFSAVAHSAPSPNSSSSVSQTLRQRLGGRILLAVQSRGQAWYVNPVDDKRYFLGRPADAFNLMRRLALGISNQNFSALEKNPSAWRRLAGRILLKPADHGRAYYFSAVNLRLYYLGRPADAFRVMRTQALGITNGNLAEIPIAN